MPEIRTVRRPVEMTTVSMQCPECLRGEMVAGNTVLTVNPPLYPSKCVECGHKANLERAYPYVEYGAAR